MVTRSERSAFVFYAKIFYAYGSFICVRPIMRST